MPVQGTVEPARTGRVRLAVASDRRPDVAGQAARPALDGALELMERRQLSASEFRILLALLDGEVSSSEFAEAFSRPSEEIRRVAARLYGRGLLRWRHDAASKEVVFGITRAGLATLRPVLTAAATAA